MWAACALSAERHNFSYIVGQNGDRAYFRIGQHRKQWRRVSEGFGGVENESPRGARVMRAGGGDIRVCGEDGGESGRGFGCGEGFKGRGKSLWGRLGFRLDCGAKGRIGQGRAVAGLYQWG